MQTDVIPPFTGDTDETDDVLLAAWRRQTREDITAAGLDEISFSDGKYRIGHAND